MELYNILIVDDEVGNLNALERTFRGEYNVFSATNGEDALAILGKTDIALVITDHRMPGMNGIEFLEKTLRNYPDIIRVILTAYTDEKLLMDAINMGHVYRFMTKPWDPEEVKAVVRQGVEAYKTTRASRELYTRTLLSSGIISEEQLDSALRIQRTVRKKKVGEILIELGIIKQDQLEIAMKLQESERKKIGELLIDLGAISPEDLEMSLEMQKHDKRRLGEILVNLGYADEESIFSCYALQLGMPYISLSQFAKKSGYADLLPSKLAYQYDIVPVDLVGRVLVVAALEPLSDTIKAEIEKAIGYKIMIVCTSHKELEFAMAQCYPNRLSTG